MKRYSILIHGTGTCGEGNPQSADMALQNLLKDLRSAGHNIASVSMVIDGSTVPIVGAMQPHPAADAPASADAVSLVSIARQLVAIDSKCDTIIAGTKKDWPPPVVEGKPAAVTGARRQRVKKEEGAAPEAAGLTEAESAEAQPPSTPPPGVVEGTTGDDALSQTADNETAA